MKTVTTHVQIKGEYLVKIVFHFLKLQDLAYRVSHFGCMQCGDACASVIHSAPDLMHVLVSSTVRLT